MVPDGVPDPTPEQALAPTTIVDSDHPDIVAFAREHTGGVSDPVERAVRLYYAVRDGFRYDPYRLQFGIEGFKASTTLKQGHGWCVTKAVLLAAACRAAGLPARLGFADVRNHLSTERMRKQLKTDVFYWHGYTAIWLNQRWVKATPAFNIELCEKFRLKPLEFDGTEDSIYHPFDLEGRKHMEYLQMRGEYLDVPLQPMLETFAKTYGWTSEAVRQWTSADFERDVERETAGLPKS